VILWQNVARAAYEKYLAALGGGAVGATRPPAWDDLAPIERDAWIAAAQEAYDLVIAGVLA
jgi:hypothetical protein